jgi:hypothetical protein
MKPNQPSKTGDKARVSASFTETEVTFQNFHSVLLDILKKEFPTNNETFCQIFARTPSILLSLACSKPEPKRKIII